MQLRELVIADYDAVYDLWEGMPGIGLTQADDRAEIEKYLVRNPGMSFVAEEQGQLVGAVLCGHDGRRGYIHHMAVDPGFRGRGIGRSLFKAASDALAREGIAKCHLFVKRGNALGESFWSALGWRRRDDLLMFSMDIEG